MNANKENTNLYMANHKEADDVQQCTEASGGIELLRSSLLVVPHAGPKTKYVFIFNKFFRFY